ncbi:unnamed protein product, partial [Closterium sp. NIES-53]
RGAKRGRAAVGAKLGQGHRDGKGRGGSIRVAKASAEAHGTAQATAAGDTLTRGELERPWEQDSAAPRFVDSEGRQLGWQRAHLLLFYSPFCDLIFLRYTFHTPPHPPSPSPTFNSETSQKPLDDSGNCSIASQLCVLAVALLLGEPKFADL